MRPSRPAPTGDVSISSASRLPRTGAEILIAPCTLVPAAPRPPCRAPSPSVDVAVGAGVVDASPRAPILPADAAWDARRPRGGAATWGDGRGTGAARAAAACSRP